MEKRYTYLSQKHENIPTRLNYINENYEILDQMLNMFAENGYTFYMYTSL